VWTGLGVHFDYLFTALLLVEMLKVFPPSNFNVVFCDTVIVILYALPAWVDFLPMSY